MRGMWLRKSVWKAWLPRGLHPADFLVEAPSRRQRRHGRPRPALRQLPAVTWEVSERHPANRKCGHAESQALPLLSQQTETLFQEY